MIPLLAAAVDLLTFCSARDWRICVIGGLAVQRWGEPRVTRDVDVSLLTDFGREEAFIEALMARYQPRIDGAARLAIERRVLLLRASNGVALDIALAGLPYEARVAARSTPWTVEPGTSIQTCSAEDLVVLKAFAGRVQDWLDVEGIIVRQGPSIDRALIRQELHLLLELKEDEESAGRLEMLFATHPA
jgi:hypothetical protein